MSFMLSLVPLAVAVITSAAVKAGGGDIGPAIERSKDGMTPKIMTRFTSRELLEKTLLEHGAPAQIIEPDSILVDFGVGKILYEKSSPDGPYTMQVYDVRNLEALICTVKTIEDEYGSNVQSYTYDRVKASLPGNMHLEQEEVLEDNSILLTLSVE